MRYRNLIEDEKEARKERLAFKFGIVLLIAGVFLMWARSKRRK